VTNHKNVLLTKILVIGAVLLTPMWISGTHAETQQSVDLEDMRREIRQLRSQVQALRAALSEAAELDAQRAAMLSRTLRAIPATSEPSKGPADVADRSRAAPSPSPTAVPVIVPAVPAPAPATGSRASRRGDGARRAADSPAAGGMVRGRVGVPKGEPVAYVYVENVTAPAVKDQRVVIEQIGKKFVPSWAVVQRGTSILFPNRDNIYHNVFSLSSGNSFDLGLYSSSGEPKSYTFNEAGEVEIYCNIHPQMSASTLVVPNRLFAKVRNDGTFEIPGVPGGKRKIVAWAPGSRLAATWVDVESGDTAQVDLKLESKASSHKNKSGQQYGSYE
jgi:plastocyanin/outer membrane murein-binding lipoprotein Lpp